MKIHCTIVPLTKLLMTKVVLWRNGTNMNKKMHKKLHMIFSSFNNTLPSFKYCTI